MHPHRSRPAAPRRAGHVAVRRTLLPLCLAVLGALAGCGGDGGHDGDRAPTGPTGITGPVDFVHRVIDASPPGGDDCCTDVCGAGDFDGDGYVDLVLGGEHAAGPGLFWYRFPLWEKRPVATGEFTTDLQVADVDGDGAPDVVVGDTSRGLVWVRNPGGLAPAPDAAWTVETIGAGYVHDLEVGDIDHDGDLDAVTCDKHAVTLWLRTGPRTWQSRPLVQREGEGTHLADLDGDGDLDVVLGGLWFEAPADPLGGDWARHDFAPDQAPNARVQTGDVDGDGRLDVVLTVSEGEGPVSWFAAPADPRSGGWTSHAIGTRVLTGAHSLQLADFDRDGDLDVATAEMHTGGRHVLVYLQDGAGWVEEELATTGSHNLRACDLGADGDIDLVGKNYAGPGRVFELWENRQADLARLPVLAAAAGAMTAAATTAPADAWPYEPLDTARPDDQFGRMGLCFGDVNGDGRIDVVAGSLLYLNQGGRGHPWQRVALPAGSDVFFCRDVDGDDLADLVGFRGEQALWLEATTREATAWTERVVARVPGGRTQGAIAARLLPGDASQLAFTRGMHLCFLTLPPDPGQPWTVTTVSAATEEEGVAALDVDGDGDLDLATSTRDGFHLVAFLNPGPGVALAGDWPARILSTTPGRADRILAADLDGDGAPELAVSEEAGSTLELVQVCAYQAPVPGGAAAGAAAGSLWRRWPLVACRSANSLDVADFDGDGRPDLAVAEHSDMKPDQVAADNRTFLLLNPGSLAAPWRAVAVDVGPRSSHLGARAVDLDGDGGLDLVSTAWRQFRTLHAWYDPGLAP